MPWIIGGALVIGGLLSSNSASKGGKAAQKALQEGRDFATNKSGLTDYKNSGLAAQKQIDDLLGNNNGDTTASDQAFQKYLGSSGYKFQQQQGEQAITTNAAAKGMLNSGATLKASLKYGTGLGASYFNSYLQNQNTVANRGANAASNLASIYSGTGAALASNASNTVAAEGQAQQGVLNGFATLYGDQQGRSSVAPPAAVPQTGANASTIFDTSGIPASTRAA